METWFTLAVLSAVFGGFQSFGYKYSVHHGINGALLTAYNTLVVGVLLVFALPFVAGSFATSAFVLFMAFLNGLSWTLVCLLRLKALECIDSMIFFPLYKVFGPLFVILSGVLLFFERFTPFEWLGIVLSLTVPLLLISRFEKERQKDLSKGLLFVVLTSVTTAFSLVTMKIGLDAADNTIMYMIFANIFAAVGAFVIFALKKSDGVISRASMLIDRKLIKVSLIIGIFQLVSYTSISYALVLQGPLGIVYTINSLYILIPIVLSIIFYNEHWNMRKGLAIIVSIAALGLLK